MAGYLALNQEMKVRFLLPELVLMLSRTFHCEACHTTTEGIRPDEEPVLKTGGGVSRLGVRVPRLPLFGDKVKR